MTRFQLSAGEIEYHIDIFRHILKALCLGINDLVGALFLKEADLFW